MDLELLLAPISLNLPCGPDLEYDPDLMGLEQASQGRPERQTGQAIIPAEEPNWIDVKQRGELLFSRTKDLRVAVPLIRAMTHCSGTSGLASGLTLLHGLLTNYWECIHPALDPDEDNDPATRLNVLASLANPETVLRDVRSVNFISTGSHARLSVRDVLVAMSKLSAAAGVGVPTQTEIEEILRLPENASSVQALHDALIAVDGMHKFLGEKVGYDRVPDLQPLKDILKTIVQLCPTNSGAEKMPMDVEGTTVTPTVGETAPVPIIPGEIQSRADAVRMLEKICEFIEKTEPANPAPLFIRRGQRLMTKNFVEIMQDLAPDSLNQIKQITGFEPKKP
jgi:type VI secretion system protein ImpA